MPGFDRFHLVARIENVGTAAHTSPAQIANIVKAIIAATRPPPYLLFLIPAISASGTFRLELSEAEKFVSRPPNPQTG